MKFKKAENETENLLNILSAEYFEAMELTDQNKRKIFSEIRKSILTNRDVLGKLTAIETKLTLRDAIREVDRAYKTFYIAEKSVGEIISEKTVNDGKKIVEKRIPRGPLLAITPFSSPLSSPAHKIAMGILAGTSVLFKPSRHAKLAGKALFKIINDATRGKYVYLYEDYKEKEFNRIIGDDRIGIISFTGGYDTGKKIIKIGGVKKYHMELSGGNSPVLFDPSYSKYNDQLLNKIVDGIVAKNGQRCVSIKHIFIPEEHIDFVLRIQTKLIELKSEVQRNKHKASNKILGPLITETYATRSEEKVSNILNDSKAHTPLIKFERKKNYVFPTMYLFKNADKNFIKKNLNYDLPGPIVFIYLYKNMKGFEQIIEALKHDYLRSGIQLGIFTKNNASIKTISKTLIWGGIIVNDIPTFRDDHISFGGFGKSGLGKEGFFETLNIYTDPQTIVYNQKY